jgi:hypothetical protein
VPPKDMESGCVYVKVLKVLLEISPCVLLQRFKFEKVPVAFLLLFHRFLPMHIELKCVLFAARDIKRIYSVCI